MGQSTDQETFLNRIAQKLGRERRSGITPPEWPDHPYQNMTLPVTREDKIRHFIDNLAALDTRAEMISENEVAEKILDVIRRENVRSVVYQDDERLEQIGLGEGLQRAGVDTLKWSAEPDSKEQQLQNVEQADMGVTMADIGLAETGSVVLFNGGGRGRVTSLLPPIYVAFLEADRIVPRITQALKRIDEMAGAYRENGTPQLPSCINFITGPSRSADIEMDLSLGVHGPGKVYVFILDR
ncbi:MAG: lactate utilization protein C [Bacillaceae bacterium]|nr:lactate utilization protein C [Bacillaceae bacterium]